MAEWMSRRRLVRTLVTASVAVLAAGAVHADGGPATTPAAIRVALVSDPHMSDKPKDAAYGRHFLTVIDEVNAAGVDAVLISGDLTQGGTPAQMRLFAEQVKAFHAPVVRYVPGNHDVGNKVMPGQTTTLGPARLKNYQDHVGPLYFAADIAPGVRAVGITSSLLGSGLPEEEAQWAFLEKQLPPAADHPPATVTLVFSHYPPIAKSPGEPDEYFDISSGPRERLLKLLEAAGVRTLLTGHLHRPVDYTLGAVHVIGAPAVSFGLPARLQREGWVLVTVAPDGTAKGELHYIPRDPPTSQPATSAPAASAASHPR